ncbi:IS30 family transposase [Candidatus Woesearchaeota archaeon]|jgi:transposase, IS30 family|nr:IS30 family transposase [Candidatus Woesearchaeota archaeon]
MQQKRLTLSERYKISFLLEEGYSQSEISRRLLRDRTVIYREVKRNSLNGSYSAEEASHLATKRSQMSHRNIKFTAELRDLVVDMLSLDWSPEQVSHSLKRIYKKSLSIQRIYEFVALDKCEGGELYKHLRHGITKRRKKYGATDSRGSIKGRVSIDKRPAIVDDKVRIGDYEIDTVIGKAHKGALVTVVDRKSKYTLIGKVDSKESNGVANTLIDLLEPYKERVHTITADNGKEFAAHVKVSENLDCDYYFAHPYSSWERGLNENTNGLIRQYAPKGSSFEMIDQERLDFMMDRLNNRPRKTLGYRTPNEVFFENNR